MVKTREFAQLLGVLSIIAGSIALIISIIYLIYVKNDLVGYLLLGSAGAAIACGINAGYHDATGSHQLKLGIIGIVLGGIAGALFFFSVFLAFSSDIMMMCWEHT